MDYVARDLQVKKYLGLTPILALVGPRQSGKTTLLKQEVNTKDNTNYISFDDPLTLLSFNEDIDQFFDQYISEFYFTIIDEIGFVSDVGSKLKYLVDVKEAQLIIASSSEIILSQKVLSYLVGRVTILRLYPFSLAEYLRYQGWKLSYSFIKSKIQPFILYGGYPRIVLNDQIEFKQKLLSDIIMTHIQKDLVLTFNLSDEILAIKLLKVLATQVSSLFVRSSITQDLDITRNQLEKFINAFIKSSIISLIPPYYTNKRTELVKAEKLYFIDNGLRNAILENYNNTGETFENFIFSELIKLGIQPKYWRSKSKAEVDFVIEHQDILIAIEVKKGKTIISRSFRSFITKYQPKYAFVVGDQDDIDTEIVDDCIVNKVNVIELREQLNVIIKVHK